MKTVIETELQWSPLQRKIRFWLFRLHAYLSELFITGEKVSPELLLQNKIGQVPEAQKELMNDTSESNSNYIFILLNVDASWDVNKVSKELEEIKNNFGSESRVIICADSYLDELVCRCEDFSYDGYLLSSDKPEELKKAIKNVSAGKLYLSKGIICSYCITRRKEWYS